MDKTLFHNSKQHRELWGENEVLAATVNAVRAEVRELRKCRLDFFEGQERIHDEEDDDDDDDDVNFIADSHQFQSSPKQVRSSERERDRQARYDTCASTRVPRQSHGA